ncbi:MAG: winged helix-turn-helix domain-containing protein, partial [Enterococcus sp.]
MTGKKKIVRSRYQQIAVDLAQKIVENYYTVGEKLHARSTLASTYNASPETTRKAINVLVDLGIMEVHHGSGAFVASKEKAKNFLIQYKEVQSIQEIKSEIQASVEKQKEEIDNFSRLLDQLANQTMQVNKISPLLPSELQLNESSKHLE